MTTITRVIPITLEVPDLRDIGEWAPIGPVDPKTLGKLLERARVHSGLTQKEAGLQSQARFGFNIAKSSISAWEEGINLPLLSAFECLVALYDPPGGRNWFAPAYHPELRLALGMQILANVRDPWL